MSLGDNVKIRRIRMGLSQEELAHKMGYSSRSSINKIEKGINVSQRIIANLAMALNCSPAELLMEDLTIEEAFAEHEEALRSMEEFDLFRYALANCGRFDGIEWSDKEIMKLIKYAKFILEERDS